MATSPAGKPRRPGVEISRWTANRDIIKCERLRNKRYRDNWGVTPWGYTSNCLSFQLRLHKCNHRCQRNFKIWPQIIRDLLLWWYSRTMMLQTLCVHYLKVLIAAVRATFKDMSQLSKNVIFTAEQQSTASQQNGELINHSGIVRNILRGPSDYYTRKSLCVSRVFIQVNDLYGKRGIVLKFDVEHGIGTGGKHRGSKPFIITEGLQ